MKSHRRKKYRIKSKPRFIVSVIIMAGILVTAFGLISGLDDSRARTKVSYTEVEVCY